MLMRGLWVIVPLSTTYRVLLPKPFKCGTTAQEGRLVLVPSAPFITRRGLEVGGPCRGPTRLKFAGHQRFAIKFADKDLHLT